MSKAQEQYPEIAFDLSPAKVLEELQILRQEMSARPDQAEPYFVQIADEALWEFELGEPKPEDN